MKINYLVYQAIKKRLKEKLSELPIDWHLGQETAQDYTPTKSAYVGFKEIPIDTYSDKVEQYDISFYVMLIMPAESPVDQAIERHSVESTLIYRHLKSFSCSYEYVLGKQHEFSSQQLFSGIHPIQINTTHNTTNAIISQIDFKCLAYDFSGRNNYTLTSLIPSISGRHLKK